MCNEAVAHLFRVSGRPALADSVDVTPVVESQLKRGGAWYSGIRFEVSINGEHRDCFTVGTVGMGNTIAEAWNDALGQWLGLFGVALSASMTKSAERITYGDYLVSSGATIIRGEPPQSTWLLSEGAFHILLDCLNNIVSRRQSSGRFTLMLVIIVDPSGTIRGEGRIDGEVIPEILPSLQNLKWPKTRQGYMYKQYFIFDRKGA
jgi:hypothetical protein